MSTTQPADELISEARLSRLLDLDPRSVSTLRSALVLVPDERVGRLRLYRRERLPALTEAVRVARARK